MDRLQTISFYLPSRIFPEVLKYDYFFSGKVQTILQEKSYPNIDLMLQISDKHIITTNTHNVKLWNLLDHKIENSLKNETEDVEIKQLSESKVVLSLNDESLCLWDIEKNTNEMLGEYHDNFDVYSDYLIVYSYETKITIINLNTESKDSFELEEFIGYIKILSDTTMITTNDFGQMRVWNLVTKNNFILRDKLDKKLILNIIALNPDLIMVFFISRIEIWNLITCKLQEIYKGEIIQLNDTQLVNVLKSSIHIRDFIKNETLYIYPNNINGETSVLEVLPDSRIICMTKTKNVQIWNPDTGKVDLTLNEGVENLIVLKDGRVVTTCSGNLQIWN